MTRVYIRSSVIPALQCILTGVSTMTGVLLVILWRGDRKRYFPFYSDASHHDPERVILAAGENLACALGPGVSLVEYIHHLRLLNDDRNVPFSRRVNKMVRVNFLVGLLTTPFFFVVANVPSSYPWTRIHQVAASMLILMYAVQASLKLWLARAFGQYGQKTIGGNDVCDDYGDGDGEGDGDGWFARKWIGVAPMVRLIPVVTLWSALLGTALCFWGRVLTRSWGSQWSRMRGMLATVMAMMTHGSTAACLLIMAIVAMDVRHEVLMISAVR